MKTQFTETQSKNNCYSNCDKNAKPVCALEAPRLQPTTLERSESRREADLFKPVADGFLLYPPLSYFTTDPQIPVLYFPFSFWMDAWAGYQKILARRSSQIRFSWIWEQSVRYPQPVLVNNLDSKKKSELHFKIKESALKLKLTFSSIKSTRLQLGLKSELHLFHLKTRIFFSIKKSELKSEWFFSN